jgi:hypothetical protein
MQDRPALPSQLAQEGERDHALARAWPTADDDNLLGVAAASLVDCVKDEVVSHSLLIQENELFPILDLGSGNGEQLARRSLAGVEQEFSSGQSWSLWVYGRS